MLGVQTLQDGKDVAVFKEKGNYCMNNRVYGQVLVQAGYVVMTAN